MKLKNSPLILVLAQIRFAPVLTIGRTIEQIQECLRKNGFPLFEEEQVQELNLNVGNAQPDVRTKRRWIFTDLHKHRSIILTDNFIAFETCRYDVYETFSKQLRDILALVDVIIGITAVERVGLRYVDLIRKSGDRKAYELLSESLRGFSAAGLSSDGLTQTMTISQLNTVAGRLAIRAVTTSDGSILPPDLAATKLDIAGRVDLGDEVSILDIDHSSSETASYKLDEVMVKLLSLHDGTDSAFKKAVTKEAISLWK